MIICNQDAVFYVHVHIKNTGKRSTHHSGVILKNSNLFSHELVSCIGI